MSKEWIIKRPDSTQFVSNDDMIKILVDMHGAIDDSAILINTERILVGLSSLYSCTLSEHSLKNGFDSIVPLTIHSKNHIIPDILLSRKGEYDIIDDDTKITINNEFSDKLTDLFKESDVRLSDLLREIIKMFPEKIVYIKFTSCMDFNGAFESYTKCYNRIYSQPDTVISKSENIIICIKDSKMKVIEDNILCRIFGSKTAIKMFAIPLKYNDLINSDSKIYLKYDNREILIPPRYEITNYEGIFRTESLCKVDDEFNGFKYNVYDGNEQLPDCTNNTFPCKNIVNIINIDSTLYNINEISKRKSTDRRESKDFTKNIVLPSINKFNHNIIDVSNQYINKEVIRLFKKIDCEKKQDYCNKIAEQYENNTEIIQMYSFIACTLVQIARKIIPNYTYNIEDDPDYSKILTKIKDLTFGKRRSKIRNNKKVKSKSRKKRRSHAKKPRTLYSPRPPTI